MNTPWFPSRDVEGMKNVSSKIEDADFNQRISVLTGLNIACTQLSSGRFEGDFSISNFGNILICKSLHNQTVEKQVSVPSDSYCLYLLADGSEPFLAGGLEINQRRVFVLPPGGSSIVVCPGNVTTILVKISRDEIMHDDGLVDEAAEWFKQLDRRGSLIESDALVERLRSDVEAALASAGRKNSPQSMELVGRATIFRVVSSFSMEALKTKSFSSFQRPVSFERFWRARKLLLDNLRTAKECGLQSLSGLGSRRSTEQAFSEHVFMGPLAYYRVVRLHSVRRKLMDSSRLRQSIGDIASEEGFWDWSRFSTYYRRHFGELPSETRGRLEAPA
ncbi:MAG: helix-turn-helix domain-containing protein [Pseudomonadota bacterium]